MVKALHRLEIGFEQWLRDFGLAALQMSLGAVYVWFGALKLSGHDPIQAVERIAFYGIKGQQFIKGLGVWEVLIGVTLLLPLLNIPRWLERACMRALFVLLLVEIAATLGAMILGTHRFFVPSIPYVSVAGDYLLRNLVFAVAALLVAGNMRSSDPVTQR